EGLDVRLQRDVMPWLAPRLSEPTVRENAMAVIRNPIEWLRDEVNLFGHAVGSAGHAIAGGRQVAAAPPQIRRIALSDLRDALVKGFADFGEYRTDVIFLCLIYPIYGLVLARAPSVAH